MPFVVRNRITLEYAKPGSGSTPNINEARLFARRNNATGSSYYNKDFDEVVTINVVEDTTAGPFRKGRYMTFQEYQDDFGGDYYRVGEPIKGGYYRNVDTTVIDYPAHLTEVFIEETPGVVEQMVLVDTTVDKYYLEPAVRKQVYPVKK